MNWDELLQKIAPQLTFYSVQVTFAIAAFKFGAKFKDDERAIHEKFLGQVKAMQDKFRSRSIEPLLSKKIQQAIGAAYDNAADSFLGLQTDDDDKPLEGEQLKTALAPANVKAAIKDLKGKDDAGTAFLTSKSGTDFLTQLDGLYGRHSKLNQLYESVKSHTQRAYLSLFGLSLLLVLGLLRVTWTAAPHYVVEGYRFIIVLGFVLGTYSGINQHFAEERLRRELERMTLLPEE